MTKVRKLVSSALCLGLSLVLPLLTGQIQQIGNMLCPMHLPVLLCGFVCGGLWGGVVGFVAPILRYLIFGMPPVFPLGISMAFELGTYGAISGLLYHKFPRTPRTLYLSLLVAMVSGRVVWGLVRFLLAGLSGSEFPFSMFLSGALTSAIPGIVLQILLIPVIVMALDKARVTFSAS